MDNFLSVLCVHVCARVCICEERRFAFIFLFAHKLNLALILYLLCKLHFRTFNAINKMLRDW